LTLLYYHDDFLRHETGRHPESADRLRAVTGHLRQQGIWDRCHRPDVPMADIDLVVLVHDRDYIQRIEKVASDGGGRVEADTVVSPQSYAVAMRAVGATCDAVRRVTAGEDSSAFCLVRPPGHHALRAAPMGFCLFNHIAIAAQMAIEQTPIRRVLIVDWDVHHGNGTQDAFWTHSNVGFYSVHRWPFYPGSGTADETGAGEGVGMTCNVPVEFGTPRTTYLNQVQESLTAFADRVQPELILISAGFDSHRLDPVGSLGLEAEDFATLTRLVQQLANRYCQGKIVSLLEGGYSIQHLPLCVAEHLTSLLDP
jgi:acetoin utilization deacetylase AcuC-like enzyme